MGRDIISEIDWEQPFTAEEYTARRARLRDAMARAEIDAIFITSPPDVCYLTGYDQVWHYKLNLIGLYLLADSERTLFFDNEMHIVVASTTPDLGEIAYHGRGPAEAQVAFIADQIKARGWARGTIAIQPWCYGPHPSLLEAIGDELAAAGARITDASYLVEDLRLVKSSRELAVTREAGSIANAALKAARDALRPGLRETEIEAVLCGEMMRRGSGYPGIRTMIGSGPRSGAHHAPASHRRLKAGDLVHIDLCTSLHRYHMNLSRTFGIGQVDPRWHQIMDKSAGCIDAIVEGVKPGAPMSAIQEVADAFIDAAGLRQWVWFIGGYALGISMPPDWVHRHRPAPREDVPTPSLEPGIVLNFENQYDVFEGWPGGTGLGYIDTLLVTETGIEVLSDMPRNIVEVGF
jgi:Xaa-Pro aminopeptidase